MDRFYTYDEVNIIKLKILQTDYITHLSIEIYARSRSIICIKIYSRDKQAY